MTRRRAASFIEVAHPDGRRFLIESPGPALLDAVLAAIGIRKAKPDGRFIRATDEPRTPGQAKAFREAAEAIRGQDPVQ